jgi:hypothetical protein
VGAGLDFLVLFDQAKTTKKNLLPEFSDHCPKSWPPSTTPLFPDYERCHCLEFKRNMYLLRPNLPPAAWAQHGRHEHFATIALFGYFFYPLKG